MAGRLQATRLVVFDAGNAVEIRAGASPALLHHGQALREPIALRSIHREHP